MCCAIGAPGTDAGNGALEPAAEQLGESSPLAATILYRALITSVLDRSLMDSYADAAMWTLSSMRSKISCPLMPYRQS